jgi:S1-C subfamily serine protease
LAAPSSPIGRLLGGAASARPFVAFDHDKIARGDASLWAPRRIAFKTARPEGYIGLGATDTPGGVLVDNPIPGHPAAKAGIRQGDVVTAVNGTPVRSQAALVTLISDMSPGSRVTIAVLRHGVRQNIPVTLDERPR